MASEQFSLCWDNFHKNMSSGMNSLLENEDLVDVTLAVEGKYLKAHKMVLSVCSPYFRELFKVNPCKHPIVFMKDVSYVAMSDLLQFMYQGEVQVSQENLTTFIKTAEALQIKGLTGDGNGSAECEPEPEEPKEEPPKVQTRPKKVQSTPTPSPAPKRPRLSAVAAEPSTQITKTEPAVTTSTPSGDQLIQFKMEPYDQSQSGVSVPDDNVDESFADDTLDDTNADDGNEDYSMIEGGDDEPQAGTSTDGAAGEGQDYTTVPVCGDKGIRRCGVFIDGFTFHQNTTKKSAKTRNMETEITCGTVENNTNENSSVNKRKRSQNRVWIKIKEFANSKDAENHLELENCWRKASSKKNVLGKRVEYRCTGGKYREKECPARLYLLYQSLTTRVSLYSTDCEHDHYEVSDSGRGLSEELKLLIRNLFEDGITKPNSILAAIKRQNEAEPPKSKIVSFLRQLRNKKYEQSILPDWDGEDPLGNL